MSWLPRLFGIIPFGIGITVLCFLWFGDDGFHSPPLFFKVFGSFIALAFVMFGVAAFSAGSLVNRNRLHDLARSMHELQQSQTGSAPDTATEQAEPRSGYDCPNCGASIGEGTDVSPSGDVKCDYCKRWFNIHSS
ncbi:MAG: hypothetical protein ACYTGL_17035 [Planctomycetota bacterium]|jgi:hypothetical protein